MLFQKDKYFYERNIRVALIISLAITIVLFYFFPNIKDSKTSIIKVTSPLITINDIPQTIQKDENKIPYASKPPLPAIIIPNDIVNIETLDDIQIKSDNNSDNIKPVFSNEENKKGENKIISFVPRQILEVVPGKEGNNFRGVINLSLKIGINGKVIDHKVLANTTHSSECLKQVISAAYKSRWEPISIGGEKRVYWIEKTYSFNN